MTWPQSISAGSKSLVTPDLKSWQNRLWQRWQHETDLAVVSLVGTVCVCFPSCDLRQRGAPHDVHSYALSLVLFEKTLITKRRSRRKVAISLSSNCTHCTEVRASGDLNQNHGVAEGKWKRISFTDFVFLRVHVSITANRNKKLHHTCRHLLPPSC